MSKKTVVLKFGSSVLRDEADLPRAVHEIYRYWRNGTQVLAVVSALGKTTDELIERAGILSNNPHPRSVAGLLSTGEATSAALLGIALDRAGIPVNVLSPADAGLRTAGETLNAEPVDVDVDKLRESLATGVVVLSGFVGVDSHGGPTLLGRGGSDLTALYLAQKLDADAILVKDVDALYESDPSGLHSSPRRFARASWQTAIRCGDGVVQEKAARFAERSGLSFSIGAAGGAIGTVICSGPDEYASRRISPRPLRVAILGCGTVGGGVFQSLASQPQHFEIVGVADRNRSKAEAAGVPCFLYSPNPTEVIERDCDVVVELFGRIDPTSQHVEQALNLGRHVVTANKALLADRVDRLESIADHNDVQLRYRAAVGGVMPALESVTGTDVVGFSGIVNGTCNFICDELANGVAFADAVRAAQVAGFAEADPTLDISGTDAAQKLILLAREAFGVTIQLEDIAIAGVDQLDTHEVRLGKVVRLIARCKRTDSGIEASVGPVELPDSHLFASIKGAENALLLETIDENRISICGRGAGRWPTTEAVVADLFDLYRSHGDRPQPARFAVAAAASTEVFV